MRVGREGTVSLQRPELVVRKLSRLRRSGRSSSKVCGIKDKRTVQLLFNFVDVDHCEVVYAKEILVAMR